METSARTVPSACARLSRSATAARRSPAASIAAVVIPLSPTSSPTITILTAPPPTDIVLHDTTDPEVIVAEFTYRGDGDTYRQVTTRVPYRSWREPSRSS